MGRCFVSLCVRSARDVLRREDACYACGSGVRVVGDNGNVEFLRKQVRERSMGGEMEFRIRFRWITLLRRCYTFQPWNQRGCSALLGRARLSPDLRMHCGEHDVIWCPCVAQRRRKVEKRSVIHTTGGESRCEGGGHCWRQWLFLLETAYCEQVSRLFPKFFLGTVYATG
jgi:hypothetical protein